MRILPVLLLLSCAAGAAPKDLRMDAADQVRVREFYRLADSIQNQIWAGWSRVAAPLLLVTPQTEFLTHHVAVPAGFSPAGERYVSRPRQFPATLLATFPAFGPPSVIVIGQPANTSRKTSTPWLLTVMHEHFHQLQNSQPGYFQAVEGLNLSRGDKSGMWMLDFPFPYAEPEVARSFSALRGLLLQAVRAGEREFPALADQYAAARKKFFARLQPDDAKYLEFQFWQEGIARYTEVRAAEAASSYRPSPEFAALQDYEPFESYARRIRSETLDELEHLDLPKSKRGVVYSFGAAEGFLLDRWKPQWRSMYFTHPFALAPLFER